MAHQLEKKWRSKDVQLQEKADFSVMLLSDRVLSGLNKAGFKIPSPIQLEAIPIGRFGKDLLVQAKSGTGKTLVFSIIALEMLKPKLFRPQVLILAPTREIASQICSVVQSLGTSFHKLTCCSFIGGLSLQDDKDRGSACQIAVGTPGRVRQLISLCSLPTNSIRLLVFDEADQLFHGTFKLEIDEIFRSLPADKQVIATSATFPIGLRKIIFQYLRDPFVACINSTDLALLGIVHYTGIVASSLMPILEYKNKLALLEKILTMLKFCQCLVFCNMIGRVEVLCRDIKKWGFSTAYISSAKDQVERLKVLDRLKHFKCKVLVSSDVTSRGIDAENVDLVINFDLAFGTETYLHRVGRAGRYGSIGLAVSIITDKQLYYLKKIEDEAGFKSYKLPDPIPKDLIRNPIYGEYTIEEELNVDATNGNSAIIYDTEKDKKSIGEENGMTILNGFKVNNGVHAGESCENLDSNNVCNSSSATIEVSSDTLITGDSQSGASPESLSANTIDITQSLVCMLENIEATFNENATDVKTDVNDQQESSLSGVCSNGKNMNAKSVSSNSINEEVSANSAEETGNCELSDYSICTEKFNNLLDNVNCPCDNINIVYDSDCKQSSDLTNGDILENKDTVNNTNEISNELDVTITSAGTKDMANFPINDNAMSNNLSNDSSNVPHKDQVGVINCKIYVTAENECYTKEVSQVKSDIEKYIQKNENLKLKGETESKYLGIFNQSDTSKNNAVSINMIKCLQSRKRNYFCQVLKKFQEDDNSAKTLGEDDKMPQKQCELNDKVVDCMLQEEGLINVQNVTEMSHTSENEFNVVNLYTEPVSKSSCELERAAVLDEVSENVSMTDSASTRDNISENVHPIDKPILQSTPDLKTNSVLYFVSSSDESDSESISVPVCRDVSSSESSDSASNSSSLDSSNSSSSSKEVRFQENPNIFKSSHDMHCKGVTGFGYSLPQTNVGQAKEKSYPYSYSNGGLEEHGHAYGNRGALSRGASYPQRMHLSHSANHAPAQCRVLPQSHCVEASCKHIASHCSKEEWCANQRRCNVRKSHSEFACQKTEMNRHTHCQNSDCLGSRGRKLRTQSVCCCSRPQSNIAHCHNSHHSFGVACYRPVVNMQPYDIFYQQWKYVQSCVNQCCNFSTV